MPFFLLIGSWTFANWYSSYSSSVKELMLLYVSISLNLSPLSLPRSYHHRHSPPFTADAEYYRSLKGAIAKPVKWWR